MKTVLFSRRNNYDKNAKFDVQFPNAKDKEQYEFEGDEIVYTGKHKEKCAVCKELTNWYSISFGSWFCSGDCLRQMWTDYFEFLEAG